MVIPKFGGLLVRTCLFAVVGVVALGQLSLPLMAETTFMPAGIKVRQTWIVHQTGMDLAEAPACLFLNDSKSFATLWKAWRTDELPKVDFAKEIVLVLTNPENASVEIRAALSDKGVVEISTRSTQRRSIGNTYVLAIVNRAGIKAIGKTPLPAAQ